MVAPIYNSLPYFLDIKRLRPSSVTAYHTLARPENRFILMHEICTPLGGASVRDK